MHALSLIIPIYNGAPYIPDTILELVEFAVENPWLEEVIIVNDGSTDKTQDILEAHSRTDYPFRMKIHGYAQNKGKAFAIKSAIPHIGDCDALAFTDVELPYGLPILSLAVQKLESNDFVVGSRFDSHESKRQYTWYRGIATKLFRLVLPREVRHIQDTQCGLKVFKVHVFKKIFSKIQTFRWVFDVELFVIANKAHMKFETVPVQIKEKCLKRIGGVSFFRHGLYICADLISIYRNIARKKYD